MAKLKVFQYSSYFARFDGRKVQARAIVATTSRKAAAEAFGTSVYDLGNFGGLTDNEHEVATAMAEPGVVFWRPLHARRAGPVPYVRKGELWPDATSPEEGN